MSTIFSPSKIIGMALIALGFSSAGFAQIPTIGGIGPGYGERPPAGVPIIAGIGTPNRHIGDPTYPVPVIGGIGIGRSPTGPHGGGRIGGIGVDPDEQPGYERSGSDYGSDRVGGGSYRGSVGGGAGSVYEPEYGGGSGRVVRAPKHSSGKNPSRASSRSSNRRGHSRSTIGGVPLRGPGGILRGASLVDEPQGGVLATSWASLAADDSSIDPRTGLAELNHMTDTYIAMVAAGASPEVLQQAAPLVSAQYAEVEALIDSTAGSAAEDLRPALESIRTRLQSSTTGIDAR